MKHSKGLLAGFALTFSLSQANVSDAQAVPPPPKGETPITISAAHTVTSGVLTLTGNAQGQAILTNSQTGSSQTFQADAGKWAREVFLLDGGKTVGASQADHTVFWNAATGQQTGRIEARVYGFSHNQKLCFAATPDRWLQLYAYPSLQLLGRLSNEYQDGVDQFVFSPDDHYLQMETLSGRPEIESSYPNAGFVFHSIPAVKLYDLANVQAVMEFNKYLISGMGTFSPDSLFVNLGDVALVSSQWNGERDSTWQFDLTARTLTKTH